MCRESDIMHMYSIWVCYYCQPFFSYTFWFWFFNVCDALFAYISTAHYIFSIEQRQTAYRCLPLLYLQPRIETYLADFIPLVLDDRIFQTLFWRGASESIIFVLLSCFFIYLFQFHIPPFILFDSFRRR